MPAYNAARTLRRTYDEVMAQGIVDLVIPEAPGDAGRSCRDLGDALQWALQDLADQDDDTRLAARLRRYRHLGEPPRAQLPGRHPTDPL